MNRETISQKMKGSLGRCRTKEICLESWALSLEFCTLLYSASWEIHRYFCSRTGKGCLMSPCWSCRKYRSKCAYSASNEPCNYCVCIVYHLYVAWIGCGILRWMSYLWMARQKMMDERAQRTELYWWSLWNQKITSQLRGYFFGYSFFISSTETAMSFCRAEMFISLSFLICKHDFPLALYFPIFLRISSYFESHIVI